MYVAREAYLLKIRPVSSKKPITMEMRIDLYKRYLREDILNDIETLTLENRKKINHEPPLFMDIVLQHSL